MSRAAPARAADQTGRSGVRGGHLFRVETRALMALFFLLWLPQSLRAGPSPLVGAPDQGLRPLAERAPDALPAPPGPPSGPPPGPEDGSALTAFETDSLDTAPWDSERPDPFLLVIGLVGVGVGLAVWRVMRSLVRSRDRHKLEGARLKSIFESLADAVCVCDHRERASLFANAAMKRLAGEIDESRPCCHGGLFDGLPACPWCSLRGLPPGQTIKQDLRVGGVDYQARARAMIWPDGRDVTLLLLRDVSERKRLDRLRDDVERIARHDLKTPLNGVMGFAQLLQINPSLDAEALGHVEDIMRNARLMLHIINGSLALMQMEQGAYVAPRRAFNLIESLRLLKGDFASELRARRATLTLLVDGREATRLTELTIQGEKPFIESMLANVIRNAIEASPAGGEVTVRVRVAESLIIEVHNRGVVPGDVVKRFFEKYVTSGKPGGVGLGTYSARLIARAHGGDATVTSSAEEGVVVRITLPRSALPETAARTRPRLPAPSNP